ncbi:MAG: LytR family transcriptional regulator [Microbacterium sp.]|uniref:LytR family transcriptional regulator n=1 Tax=Microbacterium ginsengisoli TaxID=400772 RepID=A0A3C1KFD7_9MICO|nr:LytR family transcriptional regulator [Microbacterium sp.]HAN25213.1 LytR family transcriptional regulator [Microbacterium ginsengisoli]
MRRPRRTHGVGVRHGRLPERRPYGFVLRVLAAAVGVVVASGAIVGAYGVADTVQSIKPGIHLVTAKGKTPAAPQVDAQSGAVNILLAGTDTRTGQGGQFNNSADLAGSSGAGSNDVTMVLHVSADHTHATVISIPRDLIAPIPDCPGPNGGTVPGADAGMFNTTLSRGGLSCVVLTAEQLTGLSIPDAALISFDGVIAMSNAVGGVAVCIATPIHDPYAGLDLAAGTQTLVGSQALAFVRSRHGIGDGSDLGRISNQQLFLSALLRKIDSAGVLSNPLTLYQLAHAAVSNVQLSDTISQPTSLVSLALTLKSISMSNMVFVQYPVGTDPSDPNRVVPDSSAAPLLVSALRNDTPLVLSGNLGVGAVAAPGSRPAPAAATTTPSPTPPPPASVSPARPSSAPGAATPAPTATAIPLPSSVTGQTAAQQTCTKGN